jgi:O-antigen ligase
VTLERAQTGLLAAIAATCLVSIFAAQLLLALATVVFAARLVRKEAQIPALAVGAPLLAFCVWTLLSASFSPDPVASHDSAKKLVLFALVYLAAEGLSRDGSRERVLDAMTLGGLVLAAGSLLQFYFLGFDTPNNRPRSFLGHYMTASGLTMAVLVLGAARLAWMSGPLAKPTRADLRGLLALAAGLLGLTLLQRADLFQVEAERLFVAFLAAVAAALALSKGSWPSRSTSVLLCALAVPLSAWALIISRTRNAWLGAISGLALIAILRAPRALAALAAGLAIVLLLRPPQVIERLTLRDASSLDRFYMWQAGLDMIRDKPVFGQGPGMVRAVYPRYRWPEAPNPSASHLHDNFIQIAAERGIPCLLFWLWLMLLLFRDAWRAARHAPLPGARLCGGAALAVLGAVMVAGAFEYNFGDSEVLMFTLLVSALPYVGSRPAEMPA